MQVERSNGIVVLGRFVVAVLLFAVACDGSTSGGDAGIDGWFLPSDGGPTLVVRAPTPAAPMPPVLGPCPDGWRELTSETNLTTCEPWPEGGPASCDDDEIHLPGHAGCEPIGPACPSGDFPDDLPTSGVLYVLAGATSGDGSEALPFGTIAEATAIASPGDMIAVGAGEYPGAVTVPSGVTLRGACAARTTLSSSTFAMTAGVITVGGPDVTLRDLSVGASARPGIWVGRDAVAHIESVIVERAFGLGVMVALGGRMTASRIIVRETESLPEGSFGRGLDVEAGGVAEVSESLFERNHEHGVAAGLPGSSVRLSDCVVRDTQSDNTGLLGRGLNVQDTANGEAYRTVFEGNHGSGVFVGRGGATLVLDQVVIRDTSGHARDDTDGGGLGVQLEATARVTRTLIERNRDIAILVALTGAMLDMSDVVVRDTEAQASDGDKGVGLLAHSGGSASVTRTVFERSRALGVYMSRGGTLTLVDVTIRDTRSQESDGMLGRGLNLQEGTTTTAERVFIESSADVGVFVAGAGASLSWVDGVVRDTRSRPFDLGGGRGMVVQDGASVDLERVLIERSRDVGVLVVGGSTATLREVAIRDVASREYDGQMGRGLAVQEGAAVTGSSVLLERSRGHAIYASSGATVLLDRLNVLDTLPMECADTTCVREPGGTAIGSYYGATVRVSDFIVRDADLCGVHVAESGQLDLARGEVVGCAVGACVPIAEYDIGRLRMGVAYYENGINLDAASLVIPEPLTPGESVTAE